MGWISVKDELPNMHESVTVWGVFGFDRKHSFGKAELVFKDGSYLGFQASEKSVCDVTHWQPLPEPPKGD